MSLAADAGVAGADGGSPSACVESALGEGRSFRVVAEGQGVDSIVRYAWLVDRAGNVQALSYDSNVCGGGQSCPAAPPCGPQITRRACLGASAGADGRVQCAQLGEPVTLCTPVEPL